MYPGRPIHNEVAKEAMSNVARACKSAEPEAQGPDCLAFDKCSTGKGHLAASLPAC
ncbi:GL22990 [Drosophila persimilis]|uniref:GL22990 n=1 Tax=Drosophila persimilis TaxID=7234 RepID=B4HDL6_DROPE|nr:GL22990 [Drosophila persimilis]